MISIVLSHRLIVTGYDTEERKQLFDFCNRYGTAEKEASSYSYDQSPTLYPFHHIKENSIEIYRGLQSELLNFLQERAIRFDYTTDYQVNERIDIQSNIKELREYQKEIDLILESANFWYILVPTGGGKTVVMINEILRRGEKTLVLVHNKKLLYQFIDRVLKFTNLDEKHIGVYGDSKKELQHITVALMQSFWKMTPSEIQKVTGQYDLFMIDEAHHLTAATFFKIASNTKSERLYWLTATPDKSEGLSLIFMEKTLWPLLYRVTEQQLQETGVILKPNFIPIVNEDSYVWDMYQTTYKLEEGVEDQRLHSDQFLANNLSFEEKYCDPTKATVVLCRNKKDLNSLYATVVHQSTKNKIKIIPSPLYKSHSNILTPGSITFALETPEGKRKVDMHKIKDSLYFRPNRAQLIYQVILHEFKNNRNKNPYILVLSDRIEHCNYLYEGIPEVLKRYSVVFHGALKKKEQTEREELIDSKKVRVIFSIDKFVWEGWDKDFLDTLIITHAVKDHEGVKQYVGRVIRSLEGKKYATVYDIVDINCGVTKNQFKKRYQNYYSLQSYYDENLVDSILRRKT